MNIHIALHIPTWVLWVVCAPVVVVIVALALFGYLLLRDAGSSWGV